ncbi:MAG TPA: protein kinase [Polyangiaceae bacterium]|nr:protein kinase [Polyangiaceae bacterium]
MKAGSVLSGKYRLVSILGQGGMGSVWRAEHLALRAPVAVKLLAPAFEARPETWARFHREAQSAANLRSPHVVQILDHGVDQETQTPFIAMELMEGESLAERLSRVGRLSPEDTLKVITHTARALTRAHDAGILHRDLKPGNLFIVHNDDDEIVKVLDFGLAKWRVDPEGQHAAATVTGQLLGTPYYMSPEQVEASNQVDYRSDLWSLGVIAYECLVGARPFEGDSLMAIAFKICERKLSPLPETLPLPRALNAWFERALAKSPAARFQSARELAEDLRRVFGAPTSHVGADSTAETGAAAAVHRPAQSPPGNGGAEADARPSQGTVDMGRPSFVPPQAPERFDAGEPAAPPPAPGFEETVEAVVDYAAALGKRAEVAPSNSSSPNDAGEAASVEPPPISDQSVLPVARSTNRAVRASDKRTPRASVVLVGVAVAALAGVAALALRGPRGTRSPDAAAANVVNNRERVDERALPSRLVAPTPGVRDSAATSTTALPSQPSAGPVVAPESAPPLAASAPPLVAVASASPALPAPLAKPSSAAGTAQPNAPAGALTPTRENTPKTSAAPAPKAKPRANVGQSKVWLERE